MNTKKIKHFINMDDNQIKNDLENIQYSVRAPRYAVTQFKEMATAFSSPGACFERMVTERLEGLKPQMEATNRLTEELQHRINELESQSSEKDERFENHKAIISNQQQEIAELKQQVADLRQQCDEQAVSLHGKELAENQHVLTLDPLNWRILLTVAEREGKRRSQNWTPDDVVNYFIHTRFELGTLNGDLRSLPDSVVEQIKTQLGIEC